jgi:signal transduction histidine kinase
LESDWSEDAVFVDADENRIEQVYWNLVTNAIRHGEATTPRIQLRARTDGDSVEIAISDNGTGIPLEDQAHIFERFYRVHKHRARDAGGTGLGLSIVKNIILGPRWPDFPPQHTRPRRDIHHPPACHTKRSAPAK